MGQLFPGRPALVAQPNQVWCAADRGIRIIRGMAVMVEPSSEDLARNPRNSQAGGNC